MCCQDITKLCLKRSQYFQTEMFQIADCKLQGLWNLSHSEDEKQVEIPEDRLKLLGNHDLLAVNYLYQNYKKNYKGAILNEQNGFDMQLQVSVFLDLMFRYIEQKFLILVLAPEYLMSKWFQYLTNFGGLKPIRVNKMTCPEDFDDQHGISLLISFDDLDLIEHLIGYNYFAVIIDCFDVVAKKLIIKKLYGDFHIGLTTRNFCINPDQRLQWIMLNWCSPGCCGEIKHFWKIDNDNFANFRDNYRHWWFRLTRHFCDSLKDVVKEEEVSYCKPEIQKPSRKRKKNVKKSIVKEDEKEDIEPEGENMKAVIFDKTEIKNELVEQNESNTNNTSLELRDLKKESIDFKTKIDDDDDPINLLLSTSHVPSFQMESETEFEKIAEVKTLQQELSVIDEAATNENLVENKDAILLSLIDEESQKECTNSLDPEKEIFLKKQELSSQIFSEVPSTSSQLFENEDSTDILRSLID